MNRRGIALVMALLILAGMMMLGLPFLYSQSVSRAGAATAAARQAAQVYSASSIALGTAVAIYSQVDLRAGTTTSTYLGSLATDLARVDGQPQDPNLPGVTWDPSTGTIALEARGLGSTANSPLSWNTPNSRVLVRTSLGDESGKIDANTLGPLGWARVLQTANIEDKDIGQDLGDLDDLESIHHPDLWRQVNGVWEPKYYNLSQAGQLADALALHRISPHGPYRHLDDLLAVDPRHPAIPKYEDKKPDGKYLYRSGLTPAELERLRPLITMHTPGPGRQGLIDLGNQTGDDGSGSLGSSNIYLDSPWDTAWSADQLVTTATSSTGLVTANSSGFSLHSIGGSGNYPPGTSFTFWAPAALNINHATASVVTALAGSTPPPLPPIPVTTLADLADWKPWTSPRSGGSWFHAPIDVVSQGITRLDSQAAVQDGQGRVLAEERRRLVMQTLPQATGATTLAWPTQAHLERLVDQGMTNASTSWPEATHRDNTLTGAVTVPTPSHAPWDATGIAPRPLKNLASMTGTPIPWLAGQTVQGLPLSGATWFNAFNPPLDDRDLRPDGVVIRPTAGGAQIDLTAWNPFATVATVATGAGAIRMLEVWLAPAESLPTTGAITLLNGSDPNASDRNAVNLSYDIDLECFVLRLRTGSHPSPTAPGLRRGRDDATTPLDDETASPTVAPVDLVAPILPSTHPLIPARNETVLAVYIGPWLPNRWRRLQLLLGPSLPGGMALLVDGLVGRDLTTDPSAPTLVSGDHAYLPALALKSPLSPVAPNDMAALTAASVTGTIAGFWNALPTNPDIKPGELFPSQDGVLRMGDEYLRYTTAGASGADLTFTGVWRGQRQNTKVNAAEDWPITQQHSLNTRIVPGGFRLPGSLLTGATLQTGWAATTTTLPSLNGGNGILGTATNVSSLVAGATITLTNPADWPANGVVKITALSNSLTSHWHFTNVSGTLTLDVLSSGTLTPPGLSSIPYTPANPFSVDLQLCSVGVDNLAGFEIPTSLTHIQLATANQGTVEWVGVSHHYTRNGQFYALNSAGWNTANRGKERTLDDAWPISTRVIPVQWTTGAHRGHWFLPGDAITLVNTTTGTMDDLVIRQVNTDGFASPSNPNADTINGWFTFDRQAPTVAPASVDWVVGQGQSARVDLSPLGPIDLPETTPLLTTTWRAPPSNPTKPPDTPVLQCLPNANEHWFLDALATVGIPEHATSHGENATGIVAFHPDSPTLDLPANMTADQLVVVTGKAWERTNDSPLGLLRVGQEVMAYYRPPLTGTLTTGLATIRANSNGYLNTNVDLTVLRILGRGLLGTRPELHSFGDVADLPTWTPLPATRLPLGPVRLLGLHQAEDTPDKALLRITDNHTVPSPTSGTTSTTAWFVISENPDDLTQRWNGPPSDTEPPATLLVEVGTTTGPTYHGISPMGPNRRPDTLANPNPDYQTWICPPWLRRLWGTDDVPSTTTRTPLLIGTFPRYASVLPDGTVSAEHLRSRAYAWAGFTARFARMQVDGLDNATLFTSPSDPTFLVTWRAMAGAINTVDTVAGALRGGTGLSDWTQTACEVPSTAFANKDLDGIELRASWSYQNTATTLTDLTDHQMTRPPLVMPPALPLRAPLVVLATEAR